MNIITARKEGTGNATKTFLDMELYVMDLICDGDLYGKFLLNPTKDEFAEASKETDEQIVIEPLLPILVAMSNGEMDEEDIKNADSGLYLISNKQRLFGAGAIASERLPEMIKETLGTDDVFILPSSIHEILVKKKTGETADELRAMVRSINDAQVAKDDQLSDNVYEIVDGKIVIAA